MKKSLSLGADSSHRLRVVVGAFLLTTVIVDGTAAAPSRLLAQHQRRAPRKHGPAPSIQTLTPNAMSVGIPIPLNGENPQVIDLVITGTGFQSGDVVRWDDRPLKTRFVDASRLQATVPFDYLGIDALRSFQRNGAPGSGPRGMDADGGTGKAWVRVRDRYGRLSNDAVFTVTYVVMGG